MRGLLGMGMVGRERGDRGKGVCGGVGWSGERGWEGVVGGGEERKVGTLRGGGGGGGGG